MDKIYACSNCGVSLINRNDWCDLGCGSDYNEMIEVGGRRFIEYSHKIKEKTIARIRRGLVAESTIGEHTIVVFDDIIKRLTTQPLY
ncbi:MAG: hypothetical protein AAB706_02265 [Patescibacteria group bacterium]